MSAIKISGFDFGTDETDIQQHCSKAGKVVDVTLKRKGEAVVTYASEAQAQKAVAKLQKTIIDGNTRYLHVTLKGPEQTLKKSALAKKVQQLVPKAKAGSHKALAPKAKAVANKASAKRKSAQTDNPCRVFVRGFDEDTAEEDIMSHFAEAGEVVECKVHRRTALVTFSSADEAEIAVESLNRSTIAGNSRYIDVKLDEGPKDATEVKGKQQAAKKQKQGAAEKGPSGPDLPRERVTDDPVSGRVLLWKGKFGWIKPDVAFDHPSASKKHGGKIYVHMQDVAAGELTKDDEVQFHVFSDTSGLGAEEVMSLN